jgi:hypothetical protein
MNVERFSAALNDPSSPNYPSFEPVRRLLKKGDDAIPVDSIESYKGKQVVRYYSLTPLAYYGVGGSHISESAYASR